MLHLTRIRTKLGAAARPVGAFCRRRMAVAFVGVAAAASLSACATVANPNPRNLSAEQLVQVDQACRTVIHLQPGEEHYDVCKDSLSESLNTSNQAHATQQALGPAVGVSARSYFYASADEVRRREQLSCARLGFDPSGGAFASCVTNLAATLSAVDLPQN